MPKYTVKDPETGQSVTLSGDSPPTEAELTEIFASLPAGTTAPVSSPAQPEGSALGRFASNAGAMLNPVSAAKGLYQAARHPIDTGAAIVGQMGEQWSKAGQAGREGRYSEMAGHAVAGSLPVIGPAAADIGEQIGAGDVAGGLGATAGLLAPGAIGPALRGARAVLPTATAAKAATALDTGAASRYVDVMAPKVGANKVRFGGMAEDVAPTLAKDPAMRAASREGLAAKVSDRLSNAESALDAANDARLSARTFKTQPLIDALIERRKQFTAQAVEGSRPIPSLVGEGARVGVEGAPLQKVARPIGADVVPGPSAARVGQIDQAIAELKQLGPETRYDEIRKIRASYDGPAKAIYSPAMTADYMTAQGGKLGAADVTGALREHLAQWDPVTGKANAEYAFYKKADDVLTATAEIERTRPKVGRQIMARLTGTMGGAAAAGPVGAAGGFIFAPIVEAAMSSGVTTKLATAQLMTKLAAAIRKGDLGQVTSLSYRLKRLAPTAGVLTERAASQPPRVPSFAQAEEQP